LVLILLSHVQRVVGENLSLAHKIHIRTHAGLCYLVLHDGTHLKIWKVKAIPVAFKLLTDLPLTHLRIYVLSR